MLITVFKKAPTDDEAGTSDVANSTTAHYCLYSDEYDMHPVFIQ
jgi:hypothetical protein